MLFKVYSVHAFNVLRAICESIPRDHGVAYSVMLPPTLPATFCLARPNKHQPANPFRVHDLNANDFLGCIAGIAEASLTIPLEQK